MEEELVEADAALPLTEIGQSLRRAREGKAMTLEQVAAETRIPLRHLEAIEQNRFGDLPARTYAIGFTRSYAKCVGLDADAIVQSLREALGDEHPKPSGKTANFEPGDPERVPPRALAIFALVAALLLLAGSYAFYHRYYGPGATPALEEEAGSLDADAQTTDSMPVDQGVSGSAPAREDAKDEEAGDEARAVVLTVREEPVWMRLTDGEGRVLVEKTFAPGESFTIPPDVADARINTGRPDAIAITVGGKPVAPLATDPIPIADGRVGADALLARDVAQSSERTR